MIILISPAKSLDFSTKFNCETYSIPEFLPESKKLALELKKFSCSDLEKLFHVSKNLAELNFKRFQNFSNKADLKNSRQALLAFDGDVYAGIDKINFGKKDFDFAQKHLRILSGLYGLLKPLDLIQAYRLEMGTDFKKFDFIAKNLYEFWGDKITQSLNLSSKKTVINLASEEYFSAINLKKIKAAVVNIIFKEQKAGKLKIVGINAKKARGLMVNFIIKNKITKVEELKGFAEAGYKFDSKLSSERSFLFVKI